MVAFASMWLFASVAFVFTKRTTSRAHVISNLDIGLLATVLHKIKHRDPLSEDELGLAREGLSDRGGIVALAIPATLFSLGCFYVFGSLETVAWSHRFGVNLSRRHPDDHVREHGHPDAQERASEAAAPRPLPRQPGAARSTTDCGLVDEAKVPGVGSRV
jgi:hypothetical protein